MSGRSFGASAGMKAVETFGARLIISALSIATGILIARTLGPGGKGIASGVQTMVALPIAITGGAGAALTYLMTKERRTIGQIFPALTLTFFLTAALCLAGCAAYALLRGWSFAALALALAIPPSIVLSWQQSYYVAIERVRTFNVQSIALAFFTLAGTAAVTVFHGGVQGVLGIWLAALYVFAAIIVIDMIRDGGRLHRRELGLHVRDLLRTGGQSGLNAGLGLLNYRIDSLILIALLGLPIFGIYSIAVSIGEMLFMIARPINTAIGRELGVADKARAAEITAHVVRVGFALCVTCAIPLALFAPALVHLVYGSRFDGAALPLRLLLPGIIAFCSAGTFASFFIFQLGRPVFVTVLNLIMIGAQTIACFILVPRFGLAGAAIASSVTYVVGALTNTWIFCRATGVGAAQRLGSAPQRSSASAADWARNAGKETRRRPAPNGHRGYRGCRRRLFDASPAPTRAVFFAPDRPGAPAGRATRRIIRARGSEKRESIAPRVPRSARGRTLGGRLEGVVVRSHSGCECPRNVQRAGGSAP